MNVQPDLKYTKTHEWIKNEGKVGVVGISDYAQKEISDIAYVELPEVGRQIKAEESVCVIESVKAAFDIYAPASGKIIDVNNELETDPALVNNDPYGGGWLFKVELSSLDELNALMDVSAYEQHIKEAAH